jgi:hypothetical protein
MSGSGDTAHTLVLIGLILQLVEVLVLFGIALAAVFLPFLSLVLLVFAFVGVVWLILVYLFSLAPIGDGRYEDAETPTLVFAILSLITIGLISGILYIIAYVKLRDAVREEATDPSAPYYAPRYGSPGTAAPANPFPTAPSSPAPAPAPPGARYCSHCGTLAVPGATFCKNCGAAV